MGDEIAITFETLYDILMREKQRDELLPLDPHFFVNAITYLQEKMKIWESISKDDDLFRLGERDHIENEIKNIRKVLKDIYERREKKILELALNKSRIGQDIEIPHLLAEEQQFFEALAHVLDNYRHGVLFQVLHMKMPNVEDKKMVVEIEPMQKKQKETMAIRFLHAVPKFVGSDIAIYGPFDEDDMANVPKDVGELLVKKKRAEEVKW